MTATSRKNNINELIHIEMLRDKLAKYGKITEEGHVDLDNMRLPIYSFCFGSEKPDAPVVAFIGGVHGLEVIGTQVVLSFMETVSHLLDWDQTIHDQLKHIRLLFYPCANPGGMVNRTRSNPNGVDLMRNAPLDAKGLSSTFLVGGHRISPRLPWYRGERDRPMENEAITLCDFIRREIWQSPFAMILDVHSGFGALDRIWFPFAYTKKPFPRVAEILHLKNLLDETFPHHFYHMEPQSVLYRTHGDLWDYLYLLHEKETKKQIFIPLSLELGSWAWVKKNPRQMLNSLGVFNPIIPHRHERILRRHNTLLDFLIRATSSHAQWTALSDEDRKHLELEAFTMWYQEHRQAG